MTTTKIEWATHVWNPTTGCDRVTPGCDHCYALTMAKRLKGMGSAKYQRDGDPRTSGPGFGITEHPSALDAPLSWRKPRKVFVNSMSDLFHGGVSDEFIRDVWSVMIETPQHTYQILTKRHGRMRSLLLKWAYAARPEPWPLPNVHLGVSVEDQKRADLRIDALRGTPAAVRFLSCEPLLGPLEGLNLDGISWVIVGGESGPGARPMDPDWIRSIVEQCRHQSVAVFVKQLGSVWAHDWSVNGKSVAAHGDGKGGDPQWWPSDLRVREFPADVAVSA